MAVEVLALSLQHWEHREHTPGPSRESLKGLGVKEGQVTIESYPEKGARFMVFVARWKQEERTAVQTLRNYFNCARPIDLAAERENKG